MPSSHSSKDGIRSTDPLPGVWSRRLSQTTSPSHPVSLAAALIRTCFTHWFPTPRDRVRFGFRRLELRQKDAPPGLQARFCLRFLPLVARSLARLRRHAPALDTSCTPPLGGSHSLVLPPCPTPVPPSRLSSVLPMGAARAARLGPLVAGCSSLAVVRMLAARPAVSVARRCAAVAVHFFCARLPARPALRLRLCASAPSRPARCVRSHLPAGSRARASLELVLLHLHLLMQLQQHL